ncbi:MAG: uroporphyrinogen-III synthase [Chitinophagales bacterium]
MKSTKQSAAALLQKKNASPAHKATSKPSAISGKSLPSKSEKNQKAVKPTPAPVVEKAKPVRLADLLKPKNEKNYAALITNEPKTKLKNILVAQPQPEAPKSPYYDLASKYRLKFQFTPFITVEGIAGRDFRKQRLTITDYSGVIFTSRNAIDHFFRICEELRVKLSQETKFFCTSEAIALYLQKYTQYRKRKVFFGDANNNKEIRALLLKHKDTTKCLYICPEVRSKDEITSFMDDQKIPYVEAVMYRTVPSDLKSLDLTKFDMMVLFSPSAVHSLYFNYPKFHQQNLKIGVYGKTTADAVKDAGLNFHLMAPLEGSPSIIAALDQYLKEAK